MNLKCDKPDLAWAYAVLAPKVSAAYVLLGCNKQSAAFEALAEAHDVIDAVSAIFTRETIHLVVSDDDLKSPTNEET